MTPWALLAQHGKSTNGYAYDAQRNMNRNNHGQEEWIGGRNCNTFVVPSITNPRCLTRVRQIYEVVRRCCLKKKQRGKCRHAKSR